MTPLQVEERHQHMTNPYPPKPDEGSTCRHGTIPPGAFCGNCFMEQARREPKPDEGRVGEGPMTTPKPPEPIPEGGARDDPPWFMRCPWCKETFRAACAEPEGYDYCPLCRGRFSFGKPERAAPPQGETPPPTSTACKWCEEKYPRTHGQHFVNGEWATPCPDWTPPPERGRATCLGTMLLTYRCERPADHKDAHEAQCHTSLVSWSNAAEPPEGQAAGCLPPPPGHKHSCACGWVDSGRVETLRATVEVLCRSLKAVEAERDATLAAAPEAIPPPATTEPPQKHGTPPAERPADYDWSDGVTTEQGAAKLIERIEAAQRRIQQGLVPMRIPVEHTDVDIVLEDCRTQILLHRAALRSAESRGREKGKREGMEQAAKIIEAQSSLADYRDMAALVRAALSPREPAQPKDFRISPDPREDEF